MKKILYIASIFILILTISPRAIASHPSGSLLKSQNSSTVYYIGEDNKKYVFPDGKTYATWYNSFDSIIEVEISTLDQYIDGGTMPYKAGTKLITHQNTNKIYAVEPGGILRWIPDEQTAINFYGKDWNKRVQDVIPGYFSVSYTKGDNLVDKLPTGTVVREKNTNNYFYIENGERKLFAGYGDYNQEDILELEDLSIYDNVANDTQEEVDNANDDADDDADTGGSNGGGGGGSAPGPEPYCGDNSCNTSETCYSCAADCGACPVDNDLDDDGYDSDVDCDDNNASVNPGAVDICGDGIDQDCSGVDLSCPISGEPTINFVSNDTLIDGQSYVISGSSFGIKSSVAPEVWDDFENGSAGQTDIIGWDEWTDGDRLPRYSDQAPRGDKNLSVLKEFWSEGTPGRTGNQEGVRISKPDADYSNGYLSFWMRSEQALHTGPEDSGRSMKFLGWFGNVLQPDWTPLGPAKLRSTSVDRVGCDVQNYSSLASHDYDGVTETVRDYPSTGAWKYDDQYHRYESYHEFHGMDDATSFWNTKIDNEDWGSIEGAFTRAETFDGDTQHPFVRRFFISYYKGLDGGCSGSGISEYNIYLDEIYADTTQARIELCNNSNKELATHCEMQIPHTTWDGGSIEFEANLGDFAQSNAYLFVIDEEGVVSNGYLVNL